MNLKQIKLQRESIIKELEQDITVYTQKTESYPSGTDPMGNPINSVETATVDYGVSTTIPSSVRYLTPEQITRRSFGNIKSSAIEFYCNQSYLSALKSATKIEYDSKEWQVYIEDGKQMSIKQIRNHAGEYDRLRVVCQERL